MTADIPGASFREQSRRRPLLIVGLLAVVGLALLAFVGVVGGLGVWLILSLPPPPAQPAPRVKPENRDPYSPDCAIVRTWLEQNYPGAEVTSWGSRTINRPAAHLPLPSSVTLTVWFRPKGSWRTKSGFFIIGPGDVVEHATITD